MSAPDPIIRPDLNAQTERASEGPPGNLAGARILVVDDEPTTVELLTRYLSREGYQVVTATNGAEALTQIKQAKPDLVLLDVTMPVLDGLTVCRELRKDYLTRSLPIILVTARGTLNDRLTGLQVGIDDYITKPFDLDEVKARLEGALQRRRWDLWSHPLTHLPGSPAIEEEVRRRLRKESPFAFAYIDIDFFKAYNDVYGYDAGDKVIKDVASLLIETLKEPPGSEPTFAGHVGGDDFVFLSSIDHMKTAMPGVAEVFDTQKSKYYRREDLERQGIRTKNRKGEEKCFPLMSLSIAVVSTAVHQISHYARLVEMASELKQFVKAQTHEGKSLVLWDRRKDQGDIP